MDARVTEPDGQLDVEVGDGIEQNMVHLLREIKQFTGGEGDETVIAREVRQKLEAILYLPVAGSRLPLAGVSEYGQVVEYLRASPVAVLEASPNDELAVWGTLFGWLFTHALGKVVDGISSGQISRSWVDEWLLGRIIAGTLQDLGLDEGVSWWAVETVKVLINHQDWCEMVDREGEWAVQVLESWLKDDTVQQLLRVNRYQGILWFNKEAFEQLVWWMLRLAVVVVGADPLRSASEVGPDIVACYEAGQELLRAAERSGYQVETLLEVVQG
jgi:hypothetical protein